jgi:AcrR family transcriptional regulator
VPGLPRRADSRRTVDRILETAIRTLGNDPAASMERVAEAASVHRATLYRYFPAREVLITMLAERAIAEGQALVAATAALPPDRAAVDQLAEATVAFGDRYAFLIGTDAIAAAGPDPIGLIALMAAWQGAGIVDPEAPPAWLAAAFIALATALSTLEDQSTPAQRTRRLAGTFLDGTGTGGA